MKTYRALGGALVCSVWLCAIHGVAQTWIETSAPFGWCVACSADGSKVAVIGSISTNSGATWSPSGAPDVRGWAIAFSADGTRLVVAGVGATCISTNSGENWIQTPAPFNDMPGVISASADCQKLVVGTFIEGTPLIARMFASTNMAGTWVTTGGGCCKSVASSANGDKVVAGHCYPTSHGSCSAIEMSADAGMTWSSSSALCANAVASSVDGSILMAGTTYGQIFVSTNFGATWDDRSAPVAQPWTWTTLAVSANGMRAVAAGRPAFAGNTNGSIFTSADSGRSWLSNSVPALPWRSTASSADGCRLFAAGQNGAVYTLQTTPSPELSVRASQNNLIISWIVPSVEFVLQGSHDLVTWSDVDITPVMDLTNLRYEATLPTPTGKQFYRLATP